MRTIDEIFCLVDDFCNDNQVNCQNILLTVNGQRKRNRPTKLIASEIITILISYQFSKYRDFKAYYTRHVQSELKSAFPNLVSYNRFVELIPRVLSLLAMLLKASFAQPTGISFIDSTLLSVCHYKRISSHKVFKGIAAIGKSTKGWFFGFKVHLLCNHSGGLLAANITPGNVDDRKPVIGMAKNIFGKLYGDKGYISQKLFDELSNMRVTLVTSIRKNMKQKFMSIFDKAVLKKRGVIESINNQIKNLFQIEHTRHRSPLNAFAHILSSLIAYCIHPNKPAANIDDARFQALKLTA